MNEYLSENILVYVAVKRECRGKGLGKKLIEHTIKYCKGDIAIHINKENPAINLFKDKGFKVIGVSLDREKEAWTKAIADDKLTWLQVSNLKYWDDEIAKEYAVESIPATFLLDENGIIVAKNLRGDELEAKVAELLK